VFTIKLTKTNDNYELFFSLLANILADRRFLQNTPFINEPYAHGHGGEKSKTGQNKLSAAGKVGKQTFRLAVQRENMCESGFEFGARLSLAGRQAASVLRARLCFRMAAIIATKIHLTVIQRNASDNLLLLICPLHNCKDDTEASVFPKHARRPKVSRDLISVFVY